MPYKDNRQYRTLEILQPQPEQQEQENSYIAQGYATIFNKPYILAQVDGIPYFEIIDSHALDNADMTDVILQYDHRGKVYARQSNNTLQLQADSKGLFICADLSSSDASKELYQEIKSGLITKMSWSFIVSDESYDSITRTRTVKAISKVFDVSAVSIPACQDTEISARSYLDGVIEAEKQELLQRRKRKLKLKIDLEELINE